MVTNREKVSINRPEDIRYILDHLADLETQSPELDGMLDLKKIGVAGHSFGAYTTLAVAGATVNLPHAQPLSFNDIRPLAFIALSPQGDVSGNIPFSSGTPGPGFSGPFWS